MDSFPQSFSSDPSVVVDGPAGQRAHRDHLAHTAHLERRLWEVADGVWCLVGNGLSNQTFVTAPEGIIAIDTGESVQEMQAALVELRTKTDLPVVAVICTHFHYVSGTQALVDEGAAPDLPIWGHERIAENLQRYGMDVSAVAGRGLVHQFGISLPLEGADGVANVGLGLAYRDVGHAPFTDGFIAPNHTIAEPTTATIAGLEVVLTPAPSDADDNITIWFPSLGLCVNNIMWPTLFNVFAIRGEEYRDPRVLLQGLDHIHSLAPQHLAGAHGPPLSGADTISSELIDYRDSIAFLWDQTVRGINRGLTMDELTEFVQLPERFGQSYFTQQMYGLVEHHVRQIHIGLRGWFDGNEASLFPLPHAERYQRLIAGFGGRANVLEQSQEALATNDLRWALELATWLVRSEFDEHGRIDGGNEAERSQLAAALRTIAQRTTAANVRLWCLTRAQELDGILNVDRHRVHRFGVGAVMANPADGSVHALRVLVDPARAAHVHRELRWEFSDTDHTGLMMRNGVAVPTDGTNASLAIQLDKATWAQLLATKLELSAALASGSVATDDVQAVTEFFACFDHTTLTR